MAELVGDHIGLGELAGLAAGVAAAETPLEIAEERGVEIDPLVARAIERPHRGLGRSASRTRAALIQHEPRRLVAAVRFLKDFLPAILVGGEHFADEASGLVVRCRPVLLGRTRADRRLVGLLIARRIAREDLGAADQQPRVDAERPADQPEHHDGADAEPAGAHRHAEAAAVSAAAIAVPPAILDVVAATPVLKAHRRSPALRQPSPSPAQSPTRPDCDSAPSRGQVHIVSDWFTRHGAKDFRLKPIFTLQSSL